MKTIGNDIFTVVEDPDRVELFKKLVNEDNVNSLEECTKHNLLQLAIAYDNVIGAEHVIAKGIDINFRDRQKDTALHFCASYYNQFPKDVLYLAKLLLEKGANVNVYNKWGNSPLIDSIHAIKNYELVKLFLKYGADYEKANNYGCSPLSLALASNDSELLELFRLQSQKDSELWELFKQQSEKE